MTAPTRDELERRLDDLENEPNGRDSHEEDLTKRERIVRACLRGDTGDSDTLAEAIKKATGDVDRPEHHGGRSIG